MFKYNFVANDYEQTISATDDAQIFMNKREGWTLDKNPEFVFVLGGDGTFLKALRIYENELEHIKFVPFKMGGIGYYTNHNLVDDFQKIVDGIESGKNNCLSYELLEVNFANQRHFAINEVKVINETHAIYTDVFINDEFLEEFHGSGLTFSTSTGSTGYMKSTGGAVIYGIKDSIYQMNELSPVSTNKFRTLNSPLIFTKDHKVSLRSEISEEQIVIDTQKFDVKCDRVDIMLSDTKVKLIISKEMTSRANLLRDLFVIDRQKRK